ncbi:MAG: Outer membrane lipoprotein Omp16 precursor [Lentisphaerae bacterium ADurb.BinA184]|nr:MAG: Outer membrane lipoprotein Omp16 precursor [Lentisphaerae bacterium ADurb.BinA184]
MIRMLSKLSLGAVVLGAMGVLVSGCCRTPKVKVDDEFRGLPPADVTPTDVMGPSEMGDFPGITPPVQARLGGSDLEGGDEWGTLDEGAAALVPELGAVAPGTEKRWEDLIVYFAFDRSTIGESERPKVETLAQYLQQQPGCYVIVEGHCDDRGSDEYNRALGERRALAVRDYLEALGIEESRVQTISYGEERPAVGDATAEEQHARNRRAEFVIGVK